LERPAEVAPGKKGRAAADNEKAEGVGLGVKPDGREAGPSLHLATAPGVAEAGSWLVDDGGVGIIGRETKSSVTP
jgi:hypothetical protein